MVWLVLGLLLAAGCQRKVKPADTTVQAIPSAPESLSQPPAPVPAALSGPAVLVAGLSRTACIGQCPVYTVEIYSNGSAVWKGSAHTPMQGKYRTVLPEGWLTDLMQQAWRYGFFDMQPSYPHTGRVLTDLPATISFLQSEKGTAQRIEDRGEAPAALQRFEQYFEQKLMALRWYREERAPE